MKNWDTYCAICGGPFGDRRERERHVQDRHEYQSESGRISTKTWLSDIRVIGENYASTSSCKAWLSGPAVYEDWGRMKAARIRGSPRFIPVAIRYYVATSASLSLSWTSRPFSRHRKVWLIILVQETKCLHVEYGEIRPELKGEWLPKPAPSYFEFDPVKVRGLKELYAHLPQIAATSPKENTWHRESGDPFLKLSPDILLLIISQMNQIDTLFNTRQASLAFANFELGNSSIADRDVRFLAISRLNRR
ncbi:unnamed protein product [Clonostachys rosea]|uniref:C2H2-type domain-containing protein n=1 Tax=Bionectria ochroleuca TaxID=29856 RepID=A0ABY6U6E2_BIOOC|nr:unnamed protein product [Clonostachys rosea]